jgi:NAD(P)-dependent dehydrogenase (short-subunit alcohol dehydrogenase family)
VKLQRQIAIVTGGGSGIGAALGAALVNRSCSVTLVDIDEDGAGRTAERIRAAGPGEATAETVDVRDPEALSAVVQRTARAHGRLDLLFNNAGVSMPGEVQELQPGHWQRVIDIDLYGVIHGVMAAYPLMLQQGHGHIVNTASLAGLLPTPGGGAYAAAKFGVVGLSLALRAEAAERGVRVSVVCPGGIDTPIFEKKQHPGLPVPQSLQERDSRQYALRMGGGRLYPSQRLALDVLRGVEANRAIIVAPASARLAWRLWRLLPTTTSRALARRYEQERRQWRLATTGPTDPHPASPRRPSRRTGNGPTREG